VVPAQPGGSGTGNAGVSRSLMRAQRASGRQGAVAKLSSRRPYLLRAMREWMLDNALTPHIIVDASAKDVVVPAGSVRGGRIVLNISDSAVSGLSLGNDAVEFCARFGGSRFDVRVP